MFSILRFRVQDGYKEADNVGVLDHGPTLGYGCEEAGNVGVLDLGFINVPRLWSIACNCQQSPWL